MFFNRKRGTIEITPLGPEKVGNACVLYKSVKSSLIVDCGLDPAIFVNRTDEEEDFVVPPPRLDILDDMLKHSVGNEPYAFITHGHLDHCGAVGELLSRNIPVSMSPVTSNFLYRYSLNLGLRLEDRKPPWKIVNEREYPIIDKGDERYYIIPLNHSIPGALGVSMFGGGKKVVHLSDFKFHGYRNGSAWFEGVLTRIAGTTGVDCLVMDVLNSDLPGFTPCEEEVVKNLREIILQAQGRVFISTISSNLQRIEELVKMIYGLGRSYAFMGWSMGETYKMLQRRLRGWGYPTKDFNAADVIFVAGSQGEENSAVRQLVTGGKTYLLAGKERCLEVRANDTFALSSRCIPGNEANVAEVVTDASKLCNVVLHEGELAKLGLSPNANISERMIHVSGHGQQEDHRQVITILRPKVVVPFHAPPVRVVMFEELFGKMTRIHRLAEGETLEV